jgi:hypothetical protein
MKDSASRAHLEGSGNLDLETGLRLLKAYMSITSPAARAAALAFVEQLASTQEGSTRDPLQ